MQFRIELIAFLLLNLLMMPACSRAQPSEKQPQQESYTVQLPKPFHTPSVSKVPEVVGWSSGKTPIAPAGFTVARYATLDSPRWIHVLPNGDVLVSQSASAWRGKQSPNRITLLPGTQGRWQCCVSKRFYWRGFAFAFWYAIAQSIPLCG